MHLTGARSAVKARVMSPDLCESQFVCGRAFAGWILFWSDALVKHRQQDSLRRIRRYSAGHARRLPRPVRRARFRLALESLETRNLLAASFGYDEVSPTWFQTLSPNDQPAQLSGFASATATG